MDLVQVWSLNSYCLCSLENLPVRIYFIIVVSWMYSGTWQNQAQTLSGETHHQPRPQSFKEYVLIVKSHKVCQNIVGVEMCPSQIHLLKSQLPTPQKVTLFGNSLRADVISKHEVILESNEPLIQYDWGLYK